MLARSGTVLATVLAAGCSTLSGDESSEARTVSMTDTFAYDPERITIDAGTTIRWVNEDDVDHTVTAYEDEIPTDAAYFASGEFESERAARDGLREGLIEPDERYEHAFEVPGEYGYFCVPHEGSGMRGTIRVR